MAFITNGLTTWQSLGGFHTLASPQYRPPRCFAHPPVASFRNRGGRTSAPSKYSVQHASNSHYTLVADVPNERPSYIHILPIIHIADPPSSPDLQLTLQNLHPEPKVLVLELCAARTDLLQQNLPLTSATDKTPHHKHRPLSFQTLLDIILRRQVATLQKALNPTGPSGSSEQLRKAVQTWSQQLKNPRHSIILGDRRIDRTLKQWANEATTFEKLILLLDATMAPLFMHLRPSWRQMLQENEQIDRWRSRLASRAPAAFQALCITRELHMTWAVRDSAPVLNVDSVALVCGSLHATAIIEVLKNGQLIDIESVLNADQ